MMTFTLLVAVAILVAVAVVLTILIGGTSVIVVYGDIILCAVFIILIIKACFFNKKK